MKISKTKLSGISFIIIAIICASIVAFLVIQAGLKAAPTLPVLQITKDVTAGDFIADKTKIVKIAKASVPKGAIIPGADLDKAIAKHGLSEGDILRENHIIDNNNDGGLLSARLSRLDKKNMRAVELPIESIAGMLGGMKAGDKVDIVAVFEEGSEAKQLNSKTILQDRQVIGVMTSEEDAEGTIVIAVTNQEAEVLSLYREKGKIYVTLKPFGGK